MVELSLERTFAKILGRAILRNFKAFKAFQLSPLKVLLSNSIVNFYCSILLKLVEGSFAIIDLQIWKGFI